ncbi:MAG TPA: DUF2252 domain-containing protein [Arachnia sp.]|nr:DUF2252 domain-containing protein [Arachnia sp.]HMT86962.1 DUF2252 domain-containing protein [Arachnia sp.]
MAEQKTTDVMETPSAVGGRERSVAEGKAARMRVPRESHSELPLSPDRDPVELILAQNASRVAELVPVRHGRMLVSPFTFFRGAAGPMAADLAATPSSGLRVQLCGDAHLSNFGAFGSPERRLVFDLNDFDETLPGPFEWDVKRLVASMAVAGRDNGLSDADRQAATRSTAATYRESMAEFAQMPMMDVWYSHFNIEDALARLRSDLPKKAVRSTQKQIAKALTRDNLQVLSKLTEVVDGRRRIVSDPPLIVPIEELAAEVDVDAAYAFLRGVVDDYAATLSPERASLVRRYALTGLARKVVGVGSVGTEAWILLMEPHDGLEPLLLQAKQASRSVLAEYAGESEFENQGQRVVVGQRMMQAASDIFLGWTRSAPSGRPSADYYLRQLRDWKYSVPIERLDGPSLAAYGRMCGRTLARAHARTGDRIAIASYLGGSDAFDRAVASFGEAYADLTVQDHAALAAAVASGRAEARDDV